MKLLLVDDHAPLFEALESVIRGLGDDVTVVVAADERELHAALKKERGFDLVLLDLELGAQANGFVQLSWLREHHPGLPVVVVSASRRSSDVIRAIDAGAMGFVPRHAPPAVLFDALRAVMSGGLYVPSMTLGAEPAPPPDGDTVPDVMRQPAAPTQPLPPPASARTLESLGLTPRQTDVLMHLIQGRPNRLIAKELDVPAAVVKEEIDVVLRALGVSTRTQAVLAVGQLSQHGTVRAWRPSQH